MDSGRPDFFERNRYFYGKLLTAQDFIAEQTYFQNKRRLVNRMLFGSGVVCGLNVIKMDDLSVAVESGMALDAEGREIIVPQPVVKKLSHIEGFEPLRKAAAENDGLQSAYLCLEYRESESEPIYSVARDALTDANEGTEHNRIAEGYALRVTASPPPVHPADQSAAFTETVLWDDGSIRITQTTPRFVRAGGEFLLKTRVTKGADRRPVRLHCRFDLRFLTAEGTHQTDLRFEEPAGEEREDYVLETRLRAHASSPQTGELRISVPALTVGTRREAPPHQHLVKVLIEEDPQTALLLSRWETPLETVWAHRPLLYLAKLQLAITPQYYSVEHIENRPFSQTVMSAAQAQTVFAHTRFAPGQKTGPETASPAVLSPGPAPEEAASQSGSATVNLPAGAKTGDLFTSNPIAHGLGPGTVFLTAGLADGAQTHFDGGTVFDGPVTWGVKLDQESGTFVIGARLQEDLPPGTLRFSWRAVRPSETPAALAESLKLTPSVYYAARKETVRLEAEFSSGARWKRGDLRFTMHPETGAQIDETGAFISSDQPGIFEITAQSVRDPKITATAFIVVS